MLSELQRESAGLEKTVDSLSVIDSVNETQESYREIHFTKIISAYIKPTSEAIGGFLISFRLYKAESSLAVSNIMSGLFLKVPELVLRNLLCLSEKCKHPSRLRTRNSARLSDRLRTTPRGRSAFCCAKARQKLKCALSSPLRGNRKGCTKASCVGICADLRCGARA